MLSCAELARIVASEELADSGWRRRAGISFHVLMCRHCRRYVNQLRTIAKAARLKLDGQTDPDTLSRLERAILKGSTDRSVDSTDGG